MSRNDKKRIVVDKNDAEKINIKREKNFSSEDDEALCIAWITVSTDAKVGAGQKIDTFWDRITTVFNEVTNSHQSHKSIEC